MQPVRIPRRIDEPPHMLLWSADEVAPILVGLFFGVMLEQLMISLLAGLVISHFYKKFRDNHSDGFLLHMIYWAGIFFTKAKSLKNPFCRRYIP